MAASTNDNMDMPTMRSGETDSDGDVDDWFYSTIKQYQNLHMYEVQHSVAAMCWIGQDRVCVACDDKAKGSSEILELSLPSKLLATINEGLVKDRDFQVLSGAFHNKNITSLLDSTDRCVVSCVANQNCICTWHLGDEASGTIQKTSEVQNLNPTTGFEAKAAIRYNYRNQVLFGNTTSSICLTDVTTGQTLYDTKGVEEGETICGVCFSDENTAVMSGQNSGDIWVCDVRSNGYKATRHKIEHIPLDQSATWSFDIHSGTGNTDTMIVRRSSQGHVYISNLHTPESCQKWGTVGRGQGHCMEVKCCPDNTNIVSTVDSRGVINVYDTSDWRTVLPPGGACVEPLAAAIFRHRGHRVCSEQTGVQVRTHLWHPSVKNLIFSSATDGAMHAWQFVVEDTRRT